MGRSWNEEAFQRSWTKGAEREREREIRARVEIALAAALPGR